MLCALLAALALCAYTTWGWASERRIRNSTVRMLDVERESYRMLVTVVNERFVGGLKHPTVRFEKEFIREQARNTTTRLVLPAVQAERKRTPRH